jgi:P4 family phage/plasmid primase-like protien
MGENSTGRAQKAAEHYISHGLAVIPVPMRQKNPNRPRWQTERWGLEDIPELWNNGQGVGVLWGEPSGGVVDVDCDWPEAIAVARHIMPETRTFGRPSAPSSHRVYRAVGAIPKTKRYKIPGEGDTNSVVELLSTGTQSLVPPSIHESGERREWSIERSAAEMEVAELEEAVADVSTAALLVRHWPGKGARHDYVMAATGYIGRHLTRARTQRIMHAAIDASVDEEAHKRRRDVEDTLEKLASDQPATGGCTLDQLAPGAVDQLVRWHGWGRQVRENGHRAASPPPRSSAAGGDQGIIKPLADEITAEDHFAQDAGGKLYRFSGGAYKQYAERYIKRRVKEILEESGRSAQWTSHRANEVVEYIRADAPELWARPPLDEVNVENGILNVETRELRPHDPAHLSPVQIPVRYDPSATCPAWDKFVAQVFPEDAQALAFELAADLITPSRSAQKAVLLLGEGSNGKSTYLRALGAFVGGPNTSGVSLHKLEADRFSTSRLIGKLANICPDLPSAHLAETSVFKAITGGDALNAEYKYRESFEFVPYARLVFSANHVPRSGDASHAFFRRWLVIPFNRTFEKSEQKPREELDASLSDPRELSGVLNKALDVLPRVRCEGFSETESMREAWEEFKAMTDPLAVWLEHNTVTGANAWVTKSALLSAFNQAADSQGRAGMTAQAFGRAMKRARPDVGEAYRTVGGREVKCYTGIGLKGSDGPDGEGPGGAPRAPDQPPSTTTTTDTTDSTNCFLLGEEPVEEGERESGNNNKGNGCISGNGGNGDDTPDERLEARFEGSFAGSSGEQEEEVAKVTNVEVQMPTPWGLQRGAGKKWLDAAD